MAARKDGLCQKGLHNLRVDGAVRVNSMGRKLCAACNTEYHRLMQREIRRRLAAAIDEEKVRRGCVVCGYKESPFALQWDHVVPVPRNRHQSIFRSPKAFRDGKADPNMQVLCANCHCIKTRVNGDYLPRNPA